MVVSSRFAGSPADGVHVQVHPNESPREKEAVFAMLLIAVKVGFMALSGVA